MEARQLFERGRRRAGSLGDRAHGYIATYNLAQMALSAGDHQRAAALLTEAATLSVEMGDRANLAYCFEALATVAGALGQAQRAARLAGAAQALHETLGLPVYGYYAPYRTLHQRTLAKVEATLGAHGFESAIASGRELTVDQAVEYALS